MSYRLAGIFFLLWARALSAELDELQGLNGLTDVPLFELSQQDTSALGQKALALHPEEWKHAEGEHFIYHYVRTFVASRAAVEAEFSFRVITKELAREADASAAKAHIYLFDRPEDWARFQNAALLEKWTGGIQADNSVYFLRDPKMKFSGNTLGHEITHLLLHRYYGNKIPTWLNEGFAEFISRNSRASYQRARHYLAKPHSRSLSPDKVISLTELLSFDGVPNCRVELFYDESERLVRFLNQMEPSRFLAFLEAISKGDAFDSALSIHYAGVFSSREDCEAKFRDYVSEDYGSALQDQDE